MTFLEPDRYFSRLSHVDIERDILALGFRHVLLDVDNTILTRDTHEVPRDVGVWLAACARRRHRVLPGLEQLAPWRLPAGRAAWRCPSWPRP